MRDIASLLPIELKRRDPEFIALSRPLESVTASDEVDRFRLLTIHGAIGRREVEEFALFVKAAVNWHSQLIADVQMLLQVYDAISDPSVAPENRRFAHAAGLIRQHLNELRAERALPPAPPLPQSESAA